MRAVVVATVLCARVAAADPPERAKNPSAAYALAIAGTLAPLGLVVANEKLGPSLGESWGTRNEIDIGLLAGGFVLLPSAGRWYAGDAVTWGMPMRAVGGLAALALLSLESDCGGYACRHQSIAYGVGLPGLALAIAGVVYDVATAGSAVRRSNRAHAVAPAMMRSRGTTGFGLAGAF